VQRQFLKRSVDRKLSVLNASIADFYSDTQTLPSKAMLESVLNVVTGDERQGACPTTNALCERVADLFGMEDAVFLPSGTMCNQIAIAVHTSPGDEIICARESHIVFAECGGLAKLSGAMVSVIDCDRGVFSAHDVRRLCRPPSSFSPRSQLLVTEQTLNLGGGAVWPADQLAEVSGLAKELGLSVHMDGARVLNASVATGVPVSTYATHHDSAWLAFSKGLGCPVGAVLTGSRDFIRDAWHFKRMFGGAMRQTGVLTAMCLYALDHHVERLVEDHLRAAKIAKGLQGCELFSRIYPVETNIVLAEIDSECGVLASTLRDFLGQMGVKIMAVGVNRIRMITHRDVDDAGVLLLMNGIEAFLSNKMAT
jgi:threonine aldolase